MKQRDLLKGRVKRLLKDQKDMGQVGESAVVYCASAVQVFVKDLASKMQQHMTEGRGLTPVELKKSVLASGELSFLHEKVTAIDESDAKYHKPARRGKKRTEATGAKKPAAKKARIAKKAKAAKSKSPASVSTAKKAGLADEPRIPNGSDSTAKPKVATTATSIPKQALEVEEDDDYDESDSDA